MFIIGVPRRTLLIHVGGKVKPSFSLTRVLLSIEFKLGVLYKTPSTVLFSRVERNYISLSAFNLES